MSEYSRGVLQVIVAQICQSVGWQSVHSDSLAVIVDMLDEYLRQLACISHDYAEVFGRTEINLDDVGLAFKNMNIDLRQLAEYVENAGSIPFAIPVPKYPIPREDNLNFMKPGSREILKRPIHVPEYLPPMYPKLEELEPVKQDIIFENDENVNTNQNGTSLPGSNVENQVRTVINNQVPEKIKRPGDPLIESFAPDKRNKLSDETKSLREIQSVMMTTSGCLSPTREGKLPESRTPFQSHAGHGEAEVSILDERIFVEYCRNHERKPVKPVPQLKMLTNTKFFYSQDGLTPPMTPEVPKTPEIRISKVESLANQPEQRGQFLPENSVFTPPTFPIFPMISNGPGLIPYSIHPMSSVPPQFSTFKKDKICDASKQPKPKVHSYVQNDLLPALQIDNTGKYSTISYSSPVVNAPEKLDGKKKAKNRGRRKKGKNLNRSEKRKRRKEDEKEKKKDDDDDEVIMLNHFKVPTPEFNSSVTKSVKEPAINEKKDVRSINNQPIRIRLPNINFSAPIATPGNSNVVPVRDKKKSKEVDSVTKLKSSMKSFKSECPAKKVTFNTIPPKADEPGLFPPTTEVKKKMKNQIEKPANRSSKNVKKEKPGKNKVPVIVSVIDGPDGKKIWICPACGLQDNGTPMIGCDDCDAWYHWICIGMHKPPPEHVNWYCGICINKKKSTLRNNKFLK